MKETIILPLRCALCSLLLDWIQRLWPAETDGDRRVHGFIGVLALAMGKSGHGPEPYRACKLGAPEAQRAIIADMKGEGWQ